MLYKDDNVGRHWTMPLLTRPIAQDGIGRVRRARYPGLNPQAAPGSSRARDLNKILVSLTSCTASSFGFTKAPMKLAIRHTQPTSLASPSPDASEAAQLETGAAQRQPAPA